ncbi:MAG: RNA-guided pseudouridylation complex pseudouridine synthase subunit Cbf5 [Candidatus Woesearchaeota archaeon]
MDTRMPYERITREVFERKAAKTDPKYGSDPYARDIETHQKFGIICINKPKGPTSHQVSAYTRQILSLNKTGHSGTLDPKVTGVLPVALGRATRIVQTLLPAGKEYVCLMHLHKEAKEEKIRSAMESFVGKIRQLPPIKSSVKRQWRYRKIYYIKILDIQEKDVLFRVGCQAGTYIRKLCTDIGDKIGTSAHMAELIRTKAGPFTEDEMYSLQELRDAVEYAKEGNEKFLRSCIKPIEYAVTHLPKVWVLDSTIEPVCHGTNLATPGIASVESDIQLEDTVAIMSLKNELVAIGSASMISKDMLRTEKGIAVQTHKVFMEPGTYPRLTGL